MKCSPTLPLSLLMIACPVAVGGPVEDSRPLLVAAVNAHFSVLNAVGTTKGPNGLAHLKDVTEKAAQAVSTARAGLEKVTKLTGEQKRELQAVGVTREYELAGTKTLDSELQNVPESVQEKAIELLDEWDETVAGDWEKIDTLLEDTEEPPAEGAGEVKVPLAAPFEAKLSFSAGKDSNQASHVFFSVFANSDDFEGAEYLYLQWTTLGQARPSAEVAKSWISYDKSRRVVKFAIPGKPFEYKLPKAKKK